MVSFYIADTTKSHKPKISAGKICPNCEWIKNRTETYEGLKLAKKKEKKKLEQLPKFNKTKPSCIECHSLKIRQRKFGVKYVKYKHSDGTTGIQKNNPHIKYTCKECGCVWTKGLPMPYD